MKVTNVAFSGSQTVCKVFLRLHEFICCSYTVKELQVSQGIWVHPFPQEELTKVEGKEITSLWLQRHNLSCSRTWPLSYHTLLAGFPSAHFPFSSSPSPYHFLLTIFYMHEVRGAVTWLRTDLIRLKEFNCISNPEKRAYIIQTLVGFTPTSFFLLMLPTDLRESVTSPYSTSLVSYITMATTTVLLTQPMTFSQFSQYRWPTSVHSKFQCLSHTVTLACSNDSEFPPVKENQLGMVNNFYTVS